MIINLLGRPGVVCFGGTGLLSELGSAKVATDARVLQALCLSVLLGHLYHHGKLRYLLNVPKGGAFQSTPSAANSRAQLQVAYDRLLMSEVERHSRRFVPRLPRGF